MNFASSPKSWASKRAKLLLVMPYPIFNLLFLLGDLIALAVDDKDTLRKEPYFNNIAGRIIIIFCSSFCFPLISDTASRITQSFSPQRTERFLNSVFSRAAFMMIPLLYLTFEASGELGEREKKRNREESTTPHHTHNSNPTPRHSQGDRVPLLAHVRR